MRLESTKLAMWLFPPAVIGYAWVCQQYVHVSAICVMLFLSGFFSMYVVPIYPLTSSDLLLDGYMLVLWHISLMPTLVSRPAPWPPTVLSVVSLPSWLQRLQFRYRWVSV